MEVGEFVIHRTDAKTPEMLMRVVGHGVDDMVGTVYHHHREWKDNSDPRGIWWNRPDALLDPQQFGIVTPNV